MCIVCRERLMAKVHSILGAGPLPALPFIRAADACPLTLLHATSSAPGRPPGPRVSLCLLQCWGLLLGMEWSPITAPSTASTSKRQSVVRQF